MNKLRVVGLGLVSAILCSTPISLHWSPMKPPSMSVDMADARIGRPLTPFSVAGVHRRMYRRAYYGAGAYGYGRYGYRGYAYGNYGYPGYGYGGGYGYGNYGYPSYGYGLGYGNYGYPGYGYGGGYGYPGYGYGGGYGNYGYPAYSVGIPVVVAPVLYYPSAYTYGYSGCGC